MAPKTQEGGELGNLKKLVFIDKNSIDNEAWLNGMWWTKTKLEENMKNNNNHTTQWFIVIWLYKPSPLP